MATRKSKTLKKSEALKVKDPFSVIVTLAKMGDNSIRENYEFLSDYMKKLAKMKNYNYEEVFTIRRMIRMMRMKTLIKGELDLFRKLGELDKGFKKIEEKALSR